MMYRHDALFINGEVAPVPASGPLRQLADLRELDCGAALARQLSADERSALVSWLHEGWLHFVAE